MKKITTFLLILALGIFLILLSSCESVAVYQRPGYGPPAHAPAHGFRNKKPNTVVIFNAQD